MSTENISLRKLIEQIENGQIRVPMFQRGFVWEPNSVAYLLDSIYKGYPVGSLLIWRTKEALKHERNLGPFQLSDRDPDYPIDYVLDGQQRLTSIFGSLSGSTVLTDGAEWVDVYYDLKADKSSTDSLFVSLPSNEVDSKRHFPVKVLFDAVAYRRATSGRQDCEVTELDDLQQKFQEASVPVQITEVRDRASVAVVFERINKTGVQLDTYQLLTAWTWSEEFVLQDQFSELQDDLEEFGFGEVGDDVNLIMRCCAAVLTRDPRPSALLSLPGINVREHFDEIRNGITGAIDFLKSNLGIANLRNLPYSTLLVPLSVYFAKPNGVDLVVSDKHRKVMLRWVWRSCFGRRFSAGVLRHLEADIEAIIDLKLNDNEALADAIYADTDKFQFIRSSFRIGTVDTATFILMLVNLQPRSLISGNPVKLDSVLQNYNRKEFHHLYPKAQVPKRSSMFANSLVNISIISGADNRKIGKKLPSIYRNEISTDAKVLDSHLIPASLFKDKFEDFVVKRATLLSELAERLCGG